MGLKTEYSQSNLNYQTRLKIQYSVTRESGFYFYRRRATCAYQFVAMTRETARLCQEAKIAQYTREYSVADTGTMKILKRLALGADVSTSVNGNSWKVSVSVDETDTKVKTNLISPAIVFETENGRDYDFNSAMTILRTDRINNNRDIRVYWSCDENKVERESVALQVKPLGSQVWQTSTVTVTDDYFDVSNWPTGSGIPIRLIDGKCVESNTIVAQ